MLLIGVTEFFRDKDAFNLLRTILVERRKYEQDKKNFRIWSVGCATGEEPYSLAILMLELMEKEFPHYDLQIFATDIHQRALNIARNGIYQADQLKNVPDNLREKYFDRIPEGYEIKRKVRQSVLFTKHDITDNPPFIRLDLIVCRNLMIYFNSELQREILKLFNYALNPEGLLFLGKSENISDTQYFEKVDNRNRIFKKLFGEPLHGHLRSKRYDKKETIPVSYKGTEKKEASLKDIIKETLLKTYEHPFVIVDEQNKIREIYGSVRLFMELKNGGTNVDIVKMVNQELQLDLRALLVKVKKQPKSHKSRIIRFKVFDKEYLVRMLVKPLQYLFGKHLYFMVIFEIPEDVPGFDLEREDLPDIRFASFRIRELEEELAISKDHLQTFTEELETANEELQAMNEELQSANEELKSSNEEMETANEELQSANEELSTANVELRKSNETLLEKEGELEQLNSKMEESEQRFRFLADNAPVMIWMTGPDMVGKYFNKKWLEFTGLDLEKMSQKERFNLIHSDDINRLKQAYQDAAAARKEFNIEFRLKSKDGKFNWVLVKGVPRYASSGEFIGFIGANSNIHNIKMLEERKDQFMSIAGHELKTPMTTSLAYLQLLEEEVEALNNKKLLQYIRKMSNSMRKMQNLVTDLLEVSRIEADRLNLNLEMIEFDKMVGEFVKEYSRILADREINIKGETGRRIKGDKNRLEQVVNNLLANAAKFSPAGNPIDVILSSENKVARIEVRDYGIGIEEEHIPKIFTRFYQIESSKYKSGMGVGLFISKEIVDRHGGKIKAISQKGQGTSIIVEFPAME
jgi:two-component system CheB/CheR fusion protein